MRVSLQFDNLFNAFRSATTNVILLRKTRLRVWWYQHKDRMKRRQLGLSEVNKFLDLDNLNRFQLMSLGRHEAHRLEKAFYNGGLTNERKTHYYEQTVRRLRIILDMLNKKFGDTVQHPVIRWMTDICESYPDVGERFVKQHSDPMPEFEPDKANAFLRFVSTRRSHRVWAAEQPSMDVLLSSANKMIEAATHAPSSGNRQPWRFLVLHDARQKNLLTGLKEKHCIAAPVVIFVGMDRTVYGAMGKHETGIYIDAGAAIMQMLLLAESIGLGACWNHFAHDLIYSREGNPDRYRHFTKEMNIPDHIEPIAIVSVGRPACRPPKPARLPVGELLINSMDLSK